MERWLGSRTNRWVMALGVGLMVSLVGLTLYRAGAEEAKEAAPKTLAAAKPDREALRYAGKNFDQWRIEMETELKPEVRADAMTAMAAFGANGYAVEATRTIVELMAGYDLDTKNTKDQTVVHAANEALYKIGKAAFPILWDAMRGDNERIRLFVIEYLSYSQTDWHPPVDELLKAARHGDMHVRDTALKLLVNVKNMPKSCLPVFLECLNDKETGIRRKAIDLLDKMRPEAKEVMSGLRTAIRDSDFCVRYKTLLLVEHYGAQAKLVVPAMLKRLEKPNDLLKSEQRCWGNEFVAVMNTLAAIGPAAKEALPRLRKLSEERLNEPSIGYAGSKYKTYGDLIDETIKKIEGK